MQFGDLAGNHKLKEQLATELDAGRLNHALLIEGEEGSGRRMLANILARALVCRHPEPAQRPCGACAACVKAAHPDITAIGDEQTPLTVDAIRQIREEAFLLPNESSRRVFILKDSQNMTVQAQNALLKILEEPPAHVVFLLLCRSRTQLLDTIRSRCTCVTLGPVSWEEALPVLKQRLPHTEETALEEAFSLFGGYIGRIIQGISDGTFQKVLELVPAIAQSMLSPQEWPLMALTGDLEKEREMLAGTLNGLALTFRDGLVLQYGGQRLLSPAPKEARALANNLSGQQLLALSRQVAELQRDLDGNMNNTLLLTRLCAGLRQAAGR